MSGREAGREPGRQSGGCCCGEARQQWHGLLCSRLAVSTKPPSINESGGFAKIKSGKVLFKGLGV